MHYNGPIVRPPTDAYSLMLEVTVGCSHDQCKFCNFYQGYPFKMASLEQIEQNLMEASSFNRNIEKVWAAGGKSFCNECFKTWKDSFIDKKILA